MSYELNFSIDLGSSFSGLTLAAQLLDNTWTAYGSEVTTGFYETYSGMYFWNHSTDDDFSGGVIFYDSDVPDTILAISAVDPKVSGSGSLPSYPGEITFTYTVTDSVSGNPIPEVIVRISTDVSGSNIIWKGLTDSYGIAKDINGDLPNLDAGTVYIWRQKTGYIFSDPDVEVIS